jgi:hypothetical protein
MTLPNLRHGLTANVRVHMRMPNQLHNSAVVIAGQSSAHHRLHGLRLVILTLHRGDKLRQYYFPLLLLQLLDAPEHLRP